MARTDVVARFWGTRAQDGKQKSAPRGPYRRRSSALFICDCRARRADATLSIGHTLLSGSGV